MRDNPTPAEIKLWEAINNRQLGGYKFRKQHKIGPYIADFYCHSAGLVIEVDGAIHDTRQVYDANRTEWLNSLDLKVIRFRNEEILNNLSDVKDKIIKILEQMKSS